MEIELLTNEQVAKMLGVEVGTLWSWVRRGIFVPPDIARPRYARYTAEQFARGIAKLQGKPMPEPLRSRARMAGLPTTLPVDTLPGMDVSGAAAPPPQGCSTRSRRIRREDDKRSPYTTAQKEAAIAEYFREVKTGKMTAAELGEKLGIPAGTLKTWGFQRSKHE